MGSKPQLREVVKSKMQVNAASKPQITPKNVNLAAVQPQEVTLNVKADTP